MSGKRRSRAIAIAIISILPITVAGCASSDQRLANKGFSYIEDGRFTDAEKVLTEAFQKNPDNPYAVLNLGAVYQRTGRFEEAREMFDKVLVMDANEVPARKSEWVQDSKTLREIAEDNLKTLPAKK